MIISIQDKQRNIDWHKAEAKRWYDKSMAIMAKSEKRPAKSWKMRRRRTLKIFQMLFRREYNLQQIQLWQAQKVSYSEN